MHSMIFMSLPETLPSMITMRLFLALSGWDRSVNVSRDCTSMAHPMLLLLLLHTTNKSLLDSKVDT